MKWFIGLVVAIAVIVTAAYFIGASLPREHEASGSRTYDISQEKLWTIITNVELYPHWRSNVTNVRSRSVEGDVLSWKETYESGDVLPFIVASSDSISEWVVRIDDTDLPFGGTWTYRLDTVEGGTEVTISEAGYVDNAFIRLLASVFLNPKATVQQFLIDLEDPVAALNQPINRIGWLTGTWSTERGDFERWRRATDTSYTGTGFGISNSGDTVVRESLMIRSKDDTLIYVADVPHNPAPIEFRMTAINDSMVVFANPEHDFPQKIEYYLTDDSAVTAIVTGRRKGERSAFRLNFKRQ